MNSKNIWKIIAIVAVVGLLVGASSFISTPRVPTEIPTGAQTQAASISLTIEGLYQEKQISISSGETALQLLQALDIADPEVQLVTKEYAGLGTLVEAMHGHKNGDGKKYWQYKVNDVMPQVGAGAYALKDGDSIEWFFEAFQE